MAMPDMGDMAMGDMAEPAADDAGGDAMAADMAGELDPMFAADVAEAFPDLDDAQITALQRAVMGLIGR